MIVRKLRLNNKYTNMIFMQISLVNKLDISLFLQAEVRLIYIMISLSTN